MTVLFLLVAEVTIVQTTTVCLIIALLTWWDSIMHEIKEEIRIVEMQDDDE